MPELSLIEIIKYAFNSLLQSKVFILLILELLILAMALVFSKLMNKKVVNRSCIIASLIVFGFYISNYVSTVVTFLNNVSTRLVELVYFPTTLEFMVVIIISLVIMAVTLLNKKNHIMLKISNSVFPITISFLFLTIIEYINVNKVPFDEFTVFTNPILMSLYELAMGLFLSWIIGLIVYKIDVIIINSISSIETENQKELNLVTVNVTDEIGEEEIELPKLKKNGAIK